MQEHNGLIKWNLSEKPPIFHSIVYLTILVGYNKIIKHLLFYRFLPMNRLAPKIALIVSACLLGMNFTAGAAIAVVPCPPSICCSGSMHPSDMINFADPIQKCCDECKDLFCGLLNDPLQDVKTVQPTPEMGYSHTFYAANVQPVDISCEHVSGSKPWYLLSFEMVSNPVPLYIEHLSLII